MTPLMLPAEFARRIERAGEGAYPDECCGILYGRDDARARTIVAVEPADNVFDPAQRRRRFSIAPEQLMRAERAALQQDMLVIGFYHSHPDHPARPSDNDRANAWPFYSYVIVAILNGEATDLTSWVLDEQTGNFWPARND